jgi:chaperonin GroES
MMKIRPLHDRVVLKRLESEQKTRSGIVIPETAKEKPDQGEVVAVGTGRRLKDGTLDEPDVKVGDKVLFASFAGQTVKVHGEELLVVQEEELMGVLED